MIFKTPGMILTSPWTMELTRIKIVKVVASLIRELSQTERIMMMGLVDPLR